MWLPFNGGKERLRNPDNITAEAAAQFAGRPKLSEVPFQPWARALYNFRRANQLEPHTRCKPSAGPREFLTPYGVEFVDMPELQRILIRIKAAPILFAPFIWMARASKGTHSQLLWPLHRPLGGRHSRRRLPGFNESFWFDRGGLPHTEQLHIIERFTRLDSKTLKYEATIDDPGAYTAAWSGGFLLGWDPGQELFEYVCQDNNLAHELMVGEQEFIDRQKMIVPSNWKCGPQKGCKPVGVTVWYTGRDFQPLTNRRFSRISWEAPMKRCVASVSAIALVLCAAPAFAQQKATAQNVPEIPYTSVPNFLKLPAGEYSRRIRRRRDQFQGTHLRLSPQRQHAAVGVRSERQLRQGNRQGLLRLRVRALGARRCARQHLDRRRRHEHRHEVQPEGKFLMVLGRRPPAVDGAVATTERPKPARAEVHLLPADRCGLGSARQHLRVRWLLQQPRREVRQERHGSSRRRAARSPARNPVSSTCRTGSRSMARATSGSPTAPTSATRSSTTTSSRRPSTTTSASAGPSAFRRARTSTCSRPTPIPTATLRARGRSPARSTRLELDGTIIGKFGHASKEFGGFQVVHMMDCRNPNEIIVGEIESWRVQKLILQPMPAKTSSAR